MKKNTCRLTTAIICTALVFHLSGCGNEKDDTHDEEESSSEVTIDMAEGAPSDMPQDLTMESVIAFFNEGTLGEQDFSSYGNAEREDSDVEGVLNYYINFYVPYEQEEYRVGVSYMYENDRLSDIYLTRSSDHEMCRIYTSEPGGHTVDSMEGFLKNKIQISDWLTVELPDGYTLSGYDANVGNAGGALIEPQAYEVLGEDSYGYLMEWTMSGSIAKIPDAQDSILFEDGQIVDVMLLWNHSSAEKVETLDGLDMPAILYQINHDLYTAGDLGRLEEQGISVPEDGTTSDFWYIFFAREDADEGFYLALDQRQFSKEEALKIAETVKFN